MAGNEQIEERPVGRLTALSSVGTLESAEAGEDRPCILLIDDEPQQLTLFARAISGRYDYVPVESVQAARQAMAEREFAVIICDLELRGESGTGESGLDLLREVPSLQRDAAVIIVTGTHDLQTADAALGFGAYGYLVKPYRALELQINVATALRRRALEIANRAYAAQLESRLVERTSALNDALDELESARLETLQRLSLAVAARDRMTSDHVEGMIDVVERFALRLGYDIDSARRLATASAMHDVGKIGVPDEILLKPAGLTVDERELMERHTEIGHQMLSGSSNPLLQLGAEVALAHHERWDGTGYPRGLSGEEIPISARVVQIVDFYSAMSIDRPYRDALPREIVLREIADGAGGHFDPRLTAIFLAYADALLK